MTIDDRDFVILWSRTLQATFEREADNLAELDRRVGDGDHGETMRRAFTAARIAVEEAARADTNESDVSAGDLLLIQGRAILDAGGGASGPLMASLFVQLGQAVKARGALDAVAFGEGLLGAVDLVQRMGRTSPGDKTLLDAMEPAARSVKQLSERHEVGLRDAWGAASQAAQTGRDATAEMQGRRGRAAWVEGKGEGTPDPGATSFAWILSAGLSLFEKADRAHESDVPIQQGQSPPLYMVQVDSPASDAPRPAPPGKLLNDPSNAVDEMIDGFALAFPERVRRIEGTTIVARAKRSTDSKVGLVIGNGSGHEPIAMGWVGQGMLDANAVGPIFTAPSPNLLAHAVAEADGGSGVLLLVSHHEGDRISSEMAAELARVEGHEVETLLMYDDVASAPKGREPERRGGAGTTFIYKIVGQALEEGMSLADAKALGERIRDATRTLSVALASGTSPISGATMFSLPAGEAFIGMGVHGEPGFARVAATSVDEIVAKVVNGLLDDADYPPGAPLLAVINGSGGTSLMELLVATRAVVHQAALRGHEVRHPLIGSYVTTQETKGFSVSFFHPTDQDDVRRWMAPADVPFFHL